MSQQDNSDEDVPLIATSHERGRVRSSATTSPLRRSSSGRRDEGSSSFGGGGQADSRPVTLTPPPAGSGAPSAFAAYGTTTTAGASGRARRPSEISPDAPLDPELLMPKASKYQSAGGRELLVSRYSESGSRAVVSDVVATEKPFKRVGALMNEDDFDDYGQWVTTANATFDSLDFDDTESIAFQEAKARKGGNIDPPKWKMWTIIVLAGAATGVVAFGIDEGIKGLMYLKFKATEDFLKTPSMDYYRNSTDPQASDRSVPVALPMLVFVGINWLYVTVAAALVVFGEPLAKGSGIGEIKCYLNGIRLYRVVRFKTLCCKAIGILFSVASGLPCGKEGPMIHSGAAIAGGVSTGKSSKMHFDTGFFKEFRSDRSKRNFVTAGAAAGVGVAFGAPIGGLLFAVEEVGSFWNLELTVMVFICAAIAPWVLQILQQPTSVSGSVNGLIDFGIITGSYHYYDLPFIALLGVMGGLWGTLFIKANLVMTRWRKKHLKTKKRRMVEVWVISILVSLTLILLVTLGFQCLPIGEGETPTLHNNFKNYGCNKGEYNDMATYFFRSMEDTIHILTHSGTKIPYGTILKHFIPYFILTVATYGIHVPSGLFLPSLSLGVTFGHLYAQIWNYIWGRELLDPAAYALFGATAVLGGLVRMTISVIVIIMEATANTTFFYPLVVVTVCARIVGDRFTHGVYDEHIHLNHIPLLEQVGERPEMNLMCAADVMNPDVVFLKVRCTVGELIFILKRYPYQNALMVVDDNNKFKGVLLRRQALILIDKKAWERELLFQEFAKSAREREFLKLKKYQFFERVPREADDKIIDLRRYIDQWPHVFLPSTPVSRVYRTFRELGLRHVIITDEERVPVGFVGRKQLCHLEMADARTLPISSPLPRLLSTSGDIEDAGSPATLQSWRALSEWQDAYKKSVN